MTHAALAKFRAYDRKIFWALVGVGVFTLFAYIYFISASVLSVVERKEAEHLSGRAGADVAELESRYATLDQSIDLLAATQAGFEEVTLPRYVSREGEQETLSYRGTFGGQ